MVDHRDNPQRPALLQELLSIRAQHRPDSCLLEQRHEGQATLVDVGQSPRMGRLDPRSDDRVFPPRGLDPLSGREHVEAIKLVDRLAESLLAAGDKRPLPLVGPLDVQLVDTGEKIEVALRLRRAALVCIGRDVHRHDRENLRIDRRLSAPAVVVVIDQGEAIAVGRKVELRLSPKLIFAWRTPEHDLLAPARAAFLRTVRGRCRIGVAGFGAPGAHVLPGPLRDQDFECGPVAFESLRIGIPIAAVQRQEFVAVPLVLQHLELRLARQIGERPEGAGQACARCSIAEVAARDLETTLDLVLPNGLMRELFPQIGIGSAFKNITT